MGRPLTRAAAAAVVGGLLLCIAATGCNGSKAGGSKTGHAVVLTLAWPGSGSGEVDAWAASVERLSGRSLHVTVRVGAHSGSAEAERRVVADVQAGKVPLGAVGARVFDELGVRGFQPLLAPLLVDSYPLEQRVLASPLAGSMLATTRTLRLEGLALLPGPLRVPLGVSKPFVAARDFDGAVAGIQAGQVAAQTFRALGALPRGVPFAAPLHGLDVYEQQLPAITGNRYYRNARYVTTNLALWPRPIVIVMNVSAFGRLDPRQRNALRHAGQTVVSAAADAAVADDVEAVDTLCDGPSKQGFRLATASRAQLAELRAAVEPVYQTIARDPSRRNALRQIERLRNALGAPGPAPRCPAASAAGTPARAPTPIDGVWRLVTTAADLRRAHAAPDEVISDNWGTSVTVFDRGRFATTSENGPKTCAWFYGSFSAAGGELSEVIADGGGRSEHNAFVKAGERWSFTWSIYRDVLTLGPVKGKTSPTGFRARPLQRLSSTPSSGAFPKRCPPPANWDR